jgi:hypothetical protein
VLPVFASVSLSVPVRERESEPTRPFKEVQRNARSVMKDFISVVSPIAIAGGLAIGAGAGAFYLANQNDAIKDLKATNDILEEMIRDGYNVNKYKSLISKY